MLFNMKMFEEEHPFAANRSVGYESVLRHSHSFIELVYVESGEGTQKLGNDEIMPIKNGDVFVIVDDTEHSIRPTCEESEFRIINIIFEKEEIDIDYETLCPIQPKNFPDEHPIIEYIHKCVEEYERKSGRYELRMKGWIYLIMAEYLSYTGDKKTEKRKKTSVDYVREATRYIHEHYQEKLCLEMVAGEIGITSGYLQRLFREKCKTSVIEYLLRFRVEKACKMLTETDLSVQEISFRIGFSDVKNFHYRFKRIFGVTPNQYRINHRRGE